jgi:hypothetical protein
VQAWAPVLVALHDYYGRINITGFILLSMLRPDGRRLMMGGSGSRPDWGSGRYLEFTGRRDGE